MSAPVEVGIPAIASQASVIQALMKANKELAMARNFQQRRIDTLEKIVFEQDNQINSMLSYILKGE